MKRDYLKEKYQQGGKYIIKSGDTLSSISKRLGVSIDELERTNDIKNIHQIFAGQELKYGPPVQVPLSLDQIRNRVPSNNQSHNPNSTTPSVKYITDPNPVTEKKPKGTLNLQDFLVTDEDLQYLNDIKNGYCPTGDCLASAWGVYDKLLAGKHNIPNSTNLKEGWGLKSLKQEQFNKMSPANQEALLKSTPYFGRPDGQLSLSADSWDIHGVLVDKEGVNLFTDDSGKWNKWNSLSDDQRKQIYDKITIGTIIGLGGGYLKQTTDYNKTKGLVANRHSGIVVGFDKDGIPIIYDSDKKYRRLDNNIKGMFPITNITVPKEFSNKTFSRLKQEGILEDVLKNLDLNIPSPTKEMGSFAETLKSNQYQLMADLGINSSQYNNYSEWLSAIAENETKSGRDIQHKIQTPLGLGSTIGLTQLNINNIINNPGLAKIAKKYGITQKSDLKDPNKAAIASMIYAANLDKTSKRNYESGKQEGERSFRYNPRSSAFNSKGFLAESPDGSTKYIPIRTTGNTLVSDDKRKVSDIQKDLDKFNPGTYTVKREGMGESGEIIITKKTKGNTELTPEERFMYAWQSPNTLRTGDAQGKSGYLAKAKIALEKLRNPQQIETTPKSVGILGSILGRFQQGGNLPTTGDPEKDKFLKWYGKSTGKIDYSPVNIESFLMAPKLAGTVLKPLGNLAKQWFNPNVVSPFISWPSTFLGGATGAHAGLDAIGKPTRPQGNINTYIPRDLRPERESVKDLKSFKNWYDVIINGKLPPQKNK